jgi:hypothetical protein
LLPLGWLLAAEPTTDQLDHFEKKIRPVLATRCYACHSASSKVLQGGLLVDSRDGIRKVIMPGDPAKSPLIAALKHTGMIKMPPGKPLSAEVIADFETWIKNGAADPREAKAQAKPPAYDFEQAKKHWSYQPVMDPAPPAVADPAWNSHPIDRFLKAGLDRQGLKPAARASKRALIRRVTFDLTGLPPTPDEIDAFLKDTTAAAYEKLVDRLLASPRYGERWGRHWLDVVRYADTAGCNSDFPVPPLYRYRDWVIRSFNEDKPYLDFLREQIAGDLLTPANEEDRRSKLIATSYIPLSRRFASNKNEHHLTIDDTIDNIGKSMLGLSVSCARCHDHKFDAIPQADYFGMYGIFLSTTYTFPGVETFPRPHDYLALNGKDDQKKLDEWESKVIGVQEKIRELRFGAGRNKPDSKEQIEKLRLEAVALDVAPPTVPMVYSVKESAKPANARMHYKGDPKNLLEEAPRGFLTVLGGQKLAPDATGSGRKELAGWIADPKNPLTARVMANRIWTWHFGRGIVNTPNDFGKRGEAPSHPELLDWLTSRFAESGYSVKKMHKLILTSRAYQLAAAHDAANAGKDPANVYHWRFDRRRLEAEEVRDSMLAVAGALDTQPGGAHPFPPLHQWTYSQHRQFFANYDHDKRSVYLMQQRLRKHPLLDLFDQADPNASTGQRSSNITALQALTLMNSDFVHQQADRFAVRIGMAHPDAAGRIQFAHQLALGRPATAAEVRDGAAYLAQAQAGLKDSGLPSEQHPRAALASYLRALLASDEFFFVD